MSHLDTDVSIEDGEDLRTAVKEIRQLDDELEERRIEVKEKIRRIRQQNDGYQSRRLDAFNARLDAIAAYVEDNRERILDEEGQTIDLPHADVLLRTKKATVDFDESRSNVADSLEDMDREDLVTHKRTVYVRDLRDRPDLCDKVPGVTHISERNIVRVSVPTGNYCPEDKR